MDFRQAVSQQQKEYIDLVDHHVAADLTDGDRAALNKAAKQLATHAWVGGLIFSTIGFAAATRGRARVHQAFVAFKNAPKPVEMVMQDGKHIPVPAAGLNIKEPGPWSGIVSTLFLTTFGLLVGSQIGLLSGTLAARRTIKRDADESRLLAAYKNFRIDVLKKELEKLEGSKTADGVKGVVDDFKGFWN
ncbi:hypothetical protein BDY24DRAFT_417984 [Mrakia frigida]|uniref:uncharacterized protein n=1 Tax=Mrakia frigida TaxID=29902 RepID=UPI003FCC2309